MACFSSERGRDAFLGAMTAKVSVLCFEPRWHAKLMRRSSIRNELASFLQNQGNEQIGNERECKKVLVGWHVALLYESGLCWKGIRKC